MIKSKWWWLSFAVMAQLILAVSSQAQSGVCTVGYSLVPCKSVALRTVTVAQDGSGDFRNISAAVAQAQPGDTIQVKDGRYSEFFSIDRSGTADRPITIRNYPGAHPVILPGSQRGAEISVRGDWIIFDGFELEQGWGGLVVYGAHVIVRNNYTHDNGKLSDPNGLLNGQGMEIVSTHDVLVDHNRFVRNGVYHRDNSKLHGVYVSDYYHRGMYNITLSNNSFEEHAGAGIQIYINRKYNGGNHHLLIENNTFKNNTVELISTFVEDTLVRNNTFIHDTHPRSSFKPDGFSAILWWELSPGNVVENNTFESTLNGPQDYVIFEKNRGDGQTYRSNTWKVSRQAIFKRDGTDYTDFASLFPKLTRSPDRIELTAASAGAMTARSPSASESPTDAAPPPASEPGVEALQKFAGLFGSLRPLSQVRVFVEGTSLKATMLAELGRPTYSLRPLSANRFHVEGMPAGVDILFDQEGSAIRRLTVVRPGLSNVTLTRER